MSHCNSPLFVKPHFKQNQTVFVGFEKKLEDSRRIGQNHQIIQKLHILKYQVVQNDTIKIFQEISKFQNFLLFSLKFQKILLIFNEKSIELI